MLNLFSILGLVIKRLRHNAGLAISTLVGVLAILTVAACVPIFAHAVSTQVLYQQLLEKKGATNRPLFALRLAYEEKSQTSLLDIEKSRAITQYLQEQVPRLVGLPIEQVVMDVHSGGLIVSDLTGRWPDAKSLPLGQWSFLVQDILPQHAQIVEGEWPAPSVSNEGPIPVAIPEKMADDMLFRIGDHLLVDQLEVEIVGFWRISDPHDPIWFTTPDSEYSFTLWVPQETYQQRVKPAVSRPLGKATWYVVINDRSVHFQRAAQYLRGLVRLNAELGKMVEGIQIQYTPVEALAAYEKRADDLATLFYVVGSPMTVLALIFIGLTARISVQQYESETATMRARGTSQFQVILMNLTESALLLTIAAPLALATSWWAANLMGNTLSFLQFVNRSAFTFSLDGLNWTALGMAAAIIAAARLLPAVSLARLTVMRVKQQQSRSSRPFWQRFYLDFFLLIPGVYAYFVLRGWSKPAQFLTQLQLAPGQQFRDPLLFIAPALFAMALSMIIVRLIPLLVRLTAAIIERLPGITAYLALQQIARRSEDHSSALLLIIISLSISIFTVSTAKTLDRWLYDLEYYKVGADLALQEFFVPSGGSTDAEGGSVSSTQRIEGFLTIEEHLELEGVERATRFGKYDCRFSYGRGDTACLVIGIDRTDFPQAAYYREDFARESLGELMNALGSNLDGVLLPASLAKSGLETGDRLAVSISAGEARFDRDLVVVGWYDYFPTVLPKDKPTLIMNLDSIFNYPEDAEGYSMLLKLKPDADIPAVITQIEERIGRETAIVNIVGNAAEAIRIGQDKPERIGLFGVLNVGFFTTGLMPGIGFLLYSHASLRRRFIQLGILQAIGLSVWQLIASLVLEQFVLMSLAILSGAGIGLITSLLYVPFLQTGVTPGAPVPPFQVLIGWTESGWLSLGFGAVLFVTMLGTIAYLARLQVFQAIKLGETV